jgi:HSP20 family protein
MAEQNVPTKTRKEEAGGHSRAVERRQGPLDLFRSDLFRNDPFWSPSAFTASPFALMRRFAENMEHAFPGNWDSGFGREQIGMWSPAIEVSERGDRLVVRAELPGLTKEDVKVETLDNQLLIQGERRQEHEEQEGGYRRSERRYGSFYRAVPLPEGAQTEQARAEFKDGVLEISVPIPMAQQRGRTIPIEGGGAPERKESSSAGTGQTRVSKAG